MTTRVHLSVKSRNVKTGPIPVSTSEGKTCPPACPFQGNGCYAELGHVGMFWRKVDRGDAGDEWTRFTRQIAALPDGQLWRHNQAGDLPGDGNAIDAKALSELVTANAGKRGFTYTHKPMDSAKNRAAVKQANGRGFTINLSGNNLPHADNLADLAIAPVVVVLPSDIEGNRKDIATPKGRKVVVCPATYREDVNCASCGLCAVRDRRVIVGFPAHGVSAKRVDKVASEGTS
jgi:hypothetical protein